MSEGRHQKPRKLPKPVQGDERNYVTIGENERYIYSLCLEGVLLRTRKSNMNEETVPVYIAKDKGRAYVRMDGRGYKLSTLVAKHFVPGYVPDSIIEHRDGNIRNCHVYNLLITPRGGFKAETHKAGRRSPIYADGVRYETIKDCAKSLHVSRGTLYNTLNNGSPRSVLADVKLERIMDDEGVIQP